MIFFIVIFVFIVLFVVSSHHSQPHYTPEDTPYSYRQPHWPPQYHPHTYPAWDPYGRRFDNPYYGPRFPWASVIFLVLAALFGMWAYQERESWLPEDRNLKAQTSSMTGEWQPPHTPAPQTDLDLETSIEPTIPEYSEPVGMQAEPAMVAIQEESLPPMEQIWYAVQLSAGSTMDKARTERDQLKPQFHQKLYIIRDEASFSLPLKIVLGFTTVKEEAERWKKEAKGLRMDAFVKEFTSVNIIE